MSETVNKTKSVDTKETKQSLTPAMQTNCKSCGGIMQYSPADKDLKCIYCGLSSKLDHTATKIEENNFEYWKDRANESSEEHTVEITEIKCKQCGATTTLEPNISAAKCVFCSTPLILYEASVKRFWQPEYMLPFKVANKDCDAHFSKWLSKQWFMPSKLKKGGLDKDAFKGIYMPFWTYDAETHTSYIGERGVEHIDTASDDDDGISSETTWRKVSGTVSNSFDDVVVPATTTLPSDISNSLTDWDMENCVPYQPEFLAGFTTEIYQTDFRDGLELAKKKMNYVIDKSIRSDIGGDEQKITSKETQYNDLMFKLLLLPIWISAFRYNGKLYQFVVNGRTGEVVGEYPKSKFKIALAVIAIFVIAGLLSYLII